MNLSKALAIAAIPFLLAGCATMKNYNIETEFEKRSRDYVQHIRWNELESNITDYVSVPVREEYRKKLAKTGEIKVVDYRIKAVSCDPVKGEASLKVELDYYRPPSITVRTVIDKQEWSYEGPEDSRVWRLKSPPPDFR
jgi:hypothetical protein